jgi:hypothetical protein
MSNKTFTSGHCYVPKLTEETWPICKHTIRGVLIAKITYNIVTRVEPFPPCEGVALRALQEDWYDRANQPISLLNPGCCNELCPLLDDMDNSAEMWEALWNQLDNASMKPGCSLVLLKFTSF